MKGDKETKLLLDSKEEEKKVKSRRKGYIIASSTLGVISIINASKISDAGTKIAPAILTTLPLLGAVYLLKKSSDEKDKLISIRRDIEYYRKALINMGLEDKAIYGKKL